MTNSEKQARLDAFEVRLRWPALAASHFWRLDLFTAARRASVALFNADERYCSYPDQEQSRRRAERRALKAAEALNAAIREAWTEAKAPGEPPRCVIRNNGLRYLEINEDADSIGYSLID